MIPVTIKLGQLPQDCKVHLASGEELPEVSRIRIHAGVGDITQADIEIYVSEVQTEVIDADVVVTTLPDGKRYQLVPLDEEGA